ncbi:MAG: type II toxin-antitoxin system PemK/MazF family toxin [Vicinamibacterales bacterium]
MARAISRGEIWMYRFKPPDKRRPVLVLTRQQVIGLLHWTMVAPITSTIHGVPSEVVIGVAEGLKQQCAINLDNVQSVERSRLTTYVGSLDAVQMQAVCRALAIAVGCAD